MFRSSTALVCYLFFLHHVSSLHVLTRRHDTSIKHEKDVSVSQVNLIDTSSRVDSDSTHASQVRGVWNCVAPANYNNGATIHTVTSVCTGLGKAEEFWRWGHDGHYPLKERVKEEQVVDIKRYICTLQNEQRAAPHAVAVIQPKLRELPLICLDSYFRGSPGEAVDLLNTILGTVPDKKISWISSNDQNTINFYKSLHVDCKCDNLGDTQKPVVGMIFEGRANVVKKGSYYYIDNNEVKRIYPNMCMSSDEFTTLMADLMQHSNVRQFTAIQLQNLQHPLWIAQPRIGTVLLSNLVNQVPKYKKQPNRNAFMKLNPIDC